MAKPLNTSMNIVNGPMSDCYHINIIEMFKLNHQIIKEQMLMLKEKLDTKKNEDECKTNRIDKLELELKRSQEVIKQLQLKTEDNIKTKSEIEKLQMELKQSNVTIKHLQTWAQVDKSKINEMKNHIDRLTEELEESKQMTNQFKSKSQYDAIEMNEIITEKERNEAELKKAIQTIEDLKSTDHSDTIKINEMENEKNKLVAELKEAMKTIKELRNIQNEKSLAYEKEIDKLKQLIDEWKNECSLYKNKLNIYKADFEMERESREKLAGDKDNLEAQLRQSNKTLEVLTQQLENVRQLNLSVYTKATATKVITPDSSVKRTRSDSKDTSPPSVKYNCPVCDKQFRSLKLLEQHVNNCLM